MCIFYSFVVANVPNEYASFVTLFEPSADNITTKDYVHFKGQVLDNGSVSVNNESVFVNKAGRFSHFAPIESLGEHTMTARFKSVNYDFSVTRTFIKLKNPKDLPVSQRELAVLNTDLVSERMKQSSLTDTVTRADLVYFSYQLSGDHTTTTVTRTINDIPESSTLFPAVNQMVNRGVFTLDAANNFRPNDAVNTLHFIAVYARINGLVADPEKRVDTPISFDAWYYSLVQIGLQQGVINNSDITNLKEPLTVYRFIQIASQLQEVSTRIDVVLDSKNDQGVVDEIETIAVETPIEIINQPVISTNQEQADDVMNNISSNDSDLITIDSITMLKTVTRVKGRLNERQPFTVNWKFVPVDADGRFEFDVFPNQKEALLVFFDEKISLPLIPTSTEPVNGQLDETASNAAPIDNDSVKLDSVGTEERTPTPTVAVLDVTPAIVTPNSAVLTDTQPIRTERTDTEDNEPTIAKKQYTDVSNHWIKDKLYGLNNYQALFVDDAFEPKKPVTRVEFARLLALVKNLVIRDDARIPFTDVTSVDAPYVHAVVSEGYLKGVSKTIFGSNQGLTRLQVVVAIARTLPDTDLSGTTIPFNDVERFTWAQEDLQKALAYGLIATNTKFYPNSIIDRAQLVSILYNLQQL